MKTKLIAKCQENSGNALGKKGKTIKIADKAAQGKSNNTREANIAKNYFSATPSIENLVKGAYHWAASKPWLLGESEDNLITGVAPTVGKGGPNVAKYIKNMTQTGLFGKDIYVGTTKGLRSAKAADEAIKAAQKANKVKQVKPVKYVTEVYNIKTGNPYEGPLPKDWETMLPRENWAIRTVIK